MKLDNTVCNTNKCVSCAGMIRDHVLPFSKWNTCYKIQSLHVTQHNRMGPVGSKVQNWLFPAILLNDCSYTSILVQKFQKLDIVFSRSGNIIDDVLNVQRKVDFEQKGSLKFWNLGIVLAHNSNQKSSFTRKHFFMSNSSSNLENGE